MPPEASDFTSDSDQLRSLVLITFCVFAVPSSTPASPLHRLRERKRGEQLEVLRDRMLRIARDHGHRRVGAEQLPHAADVDDDVVPEADAPFLQQRLEGRRRPRGFADRRIEHEQRLAAFAQDRS